LLRDIVSRPAQAAREFFSPFVSLTACVLAYREAQAVKLLVSAPRRRELRILRRLGALRGVLGQSRHAGAGVPSRRRSGQRAGLIRRPGFVYPSRNAALI
jgi:hypothetical protein